MIVCPSDYREEKFWKLYSEGESSQERQCSSMWVYAANQLHRDVKSCYKLGSTMLITSPVLIEFMLNHTVYMSTTNSLTHEINACRLLGYRLHI